MGISTGVTFITYMTQYNHAEMAARIDPFNPAIRYNTLPGWDMTSVQGLEMINGEITRQAATIAYLNDFRLMMYLALIGVPLVFLMRARPPDTTTDEMGDTVDEVESAVAAIH